MYRCGEAAAIRRLRRGEVIIHATEGVFGLAGRAEEPATRGRIAALKRRDPTKPLIVVVADFAQISRFVDTPGTDLDPILASWPGPETWIFKARTLAPKWLLGGGMIAVRVTAHPQFARLCRAAGPLVSTSANPSGRNPALCLARARQYFGKSVDFYLPGRLQTPGRVSRIRRAATLEAVRA